MENVILEVDNVSKNYGVVRALRDVSFTIRRGEVHTLLGENGAGKSTLIKIISGEEVPSEGKIIIDGKPIAHYDPQHAMEMGIAMVHQELAIFENMTVAENIFPGMRYRTKAGFIDRKKLTAEATKKIQMFGMNIKATQKMDELTMAQQQMVEILRCLSVGQNIILLDEPTSGLNMEEVDKLMEIIGHLREQGITIIYISHRINEIMNISDRITVLRDGMYIITYDNTPDLQEMDLISKMVGRELTDTLYTVRGNDNAISTETIFEVRNISKKKSIDNVSFELKKGEILGFFGLEGSGSDSLSRMMYGLESVTGGEVYFKGNRIEKLDTNTMVKNRIMYLNNNRKSAGLLLESPAIDNISIPVMDEVTKGIFLDKEKMVEYTEKYIKAFNIVIPSIWQLPKNLSGGNQQKLMFSICLAKEPEVLILNEPTRGVDVGAKAETHKFMVELVKNGVSIIVFSSEMPELMSLSDRIIVMRENRIAAEFDKSEISEENIMTAASGTIN